MGYGSGARRGAAERGLLSQAGGAAHYARPFDVTWALDLYEQCKEAQVPFFYKQGSALRPGQDDALPEVGQVKEWPAD